MALKQARGNPYSFGGMVKDPALFFGRDEELSFIRSRLHNGESTAVVGLRRIGKSSLLYQLALQTEKLPEGTVAIYLNLQDGTHHNPLDMLTAALYNLNEQLNRRYTFASVKSLGEFSNAVKKIASDGFRPVLCLDEVEELVDREAFDDDFFDSLRALGNDRILAFVTASLDSLEALINRKKLTSPFYNIFITRELSGLSDAAARVLLTEPFRVAGLEAPPAEYVAEVLHLAGHHPFFLQMAAFHLFEARRKSNVLDRGALREAFARDAEQPLRSLWRHLSADEQAGVKRLVGLPTAVRPWENIHIDLIRCGLAEGAPSAPRVFSAVFAEMVETGDIEREPMVRRRIHSYTTEKQKPFSSLLFTYTLIALGSAAMSLFITLMLPVDRFLPFFSILTIVLSFVLVLADRLTGGQFLDLLTRLLGKRG